MGAQHEFHAFVPSLGFELLAVLPLFSCEGPLSSMVFSLSWRRKNVRMQKSSPTDSATDEHSLASRCDLHTEKSEIGPSGKFG